jgi:hypothetical protein
MTLVPPQDTYLGPLTLDEVYFYHDGPRFFSATSLTGRYLGLSTAEDQDTDSYLYIHVSQGRFNQVRSGGFPLRRAFQEPEDGYLHVVVVGYATDPAEVSVAATRPGDVPETWYPLEGASLAIPTGTRPTLDLPNLAARSEQEGRALVALEVDPPSLMRTEYPLRALSRLTGTIQDVIHALAQEERGSPTSRGAIPADVIAESELTFNYSLAASYALVLSASMGDRLFPANLVEPAVSRLQALFGAVTSHDQLGTLLREYGPRTKSKYRELLEAFEDDGTGARLILVRPAEETREAQITLEEVRSTLYLIVKSDPDARSLDLDGVILVGVNLRTGTFEILDKLANVRYSGYMQTEAREAIEGLPTGDQFLYRVTVLEQLAYSSVSDEATTKYRLQSIERRPSDDH